MTFSTYLLSCMGQAASGSAEQSKGSSWSMIIMMVVLFAIMYFLMIRPQKKKQKEEQEMRDSIQIGDEITTIGGIMGRGVTVKEDSIVLESGADRTKMKFSRWAIQTNDTANERLQAEKDAIAAAKQAEKEEKKKGSRSKKSKSEDKSDKE